MASGPSAASERMRAFGRIVDELGGRYITAEDVGTTPADMATIAEVTEHVAGGPAEVGGRGDPSPFTARTVFGSIQSAVSLHLGVYRLDGLRVGVQGVGNVGTHLVRMLREAGAEVFVCDIDAERAQAVAAEHDAIALPALDFALGDFDVLAPCALGGAIGPQQVNAARRLGHRGRRQQPAHRPLAGRRADGAGDPLRP